MSDPKKSAGRSGADDALATRLAAGRPIEAAAAEAGVSPSTVYRRLKNPAFRSKIDEIRGRIMEEATGLLAHAATAAAAVLQGLIADKEVPASVRLNACRAILEFSLKATDQTQLIRQVQQLRDKIEELQRGKRGPVLGAGKARADGRGDGTANGSADPGSDPGGPNSGSLAGGLHPRPVAGTPSYLSVLAE